MYLFRRLSLLPIAYLLIVWTAPFSTSCLARTPDQPTRLQISVFNDARIDAPTLAAAEARASAIFSQSGIEVDWLVCGPANPADFSPSTSPCSALAWPTHLSVRLRPQALTVAADVFGEAFVDPHGQGVYSNVYYQNLLLSPNHPQLSNADLLGCVLAHELGHLLLGSNSHSSSGLMQSRWDASTLQSAARSVLLFTPAQSAILRSRLSVARAVAIL